MHSPATCAEPHTAPERRIWMVAVRGLAAADTIAQDLEEIGFDVRVRPVPNSQIYQACGTVKAQVNVCLLGYSMGADPARFFEGTFSSTVIAAITSNFSQFDDPSVDAAIRRAEEQFEPAARARAYVEVNRLLLGLGARRAADLDTPAAVHSPDVHGAALNELDYSYTSLE